MRQKIVAPKCVGAGDAVYKMIMDGDIGYELSPLWSLRWRRRDILWNALTRRGAIAPFSELVGHELLFRPTDENAKAFSKECVGPAFGQMVRNKKIIEAYPELLKAQLKIISGLTDGKKKSVNLEYLVWDNDRASDIVFQLLCNHGNSKLILEIKEDGMMPEWVMSVIATICECRDVRIYIDDLAMKVNNVPKNIEYFQKLIKYLHKYIIAVKVDYFWVRQLKGRPDIKAYIDLNLEYFEYIWRSYTSIKLPALIFESVPFCTWTAMRILFSMAERYGFSGCYFQSEGLPLFGR